MVSALYFRYCFKNKNIVTKILYWVQPSEASKIINPRTLFIKLCEFIMYTYMNFSGERILRIFQILSVSVSPK